MSRCSGRLGAPNRVNSARPSGGLCAWPGDSEKVKAVRASAARRWILVFHLPRELPIACGPIFCRTSATGVNLHVCAAHRHRFDLDLHNLGLLQPLKGLHQHARLRPSAHSRLDHVPVSEALGKAAPFAVMLGHVQDGIEYLQIRQADFDLPELGCGDLHATTADRTSPSRNSR
jgi:hypothetical protein